MVETFLKQKSYNSSEEAFAGLHSFLKGQNWTIIDKQGDFTTPALVDGDWFVCQAAKDYASGKQERLQILVKLDLTNRRWTFNLAPKGGWDDDTDNWASGYPYTSLVALSLDAIDITSLVCTYIENSTRFIIWAQYDGTTHVLGYFGAFTPFQDVETIDEYPSLIGAGTFSQTGLDNSFKRISPKDDSTELINGNRYTEIKMLTAAKQPNPASGKYDELAYQVYFDANVNFEELSGTLDGIRLCSLGLGDKDTLAGKTRLNIKGLTIPWNGTTPI